MDLKMGHQVIGLWLGGKVPCDGFGVKSIRFGGAGL